MKRVSLLLVILLVTLGANEYNDDDLDGVPNEVDRCPHTPFSDIVDEYGCSIERLIKPKKFECYFEYLYAKNDDPKFSENDYLVGLTFYKDRFDLSITSFYFDNTSKHGFSDTNVKLEYRFSPSPLLDVYLGGGVQLPIYNMHGNRVDWDLSLSYEYYRWGYKFFGGVLHTWTSDRYQGERLKNSISGFLGITQYYKSFSFELSYFYNKSKFGNINNMIYTKLEKMIKSGYYIFTTYTHGLNDQTIDSIFSVGFGMRL